MGEDSGTITRDSDGEEYYKIVRGYIEHEDELINNRNSWFITIQALLFATVALAYQAKSNLVAKAETPTIHALGSLGEAIFVDLSHFQIVLAVVGILTGWVARGSLEAAQQSIATLAEQWEKSPLSVRCKIYLPALTGGGDRGATKKGKLLATNLPIIFIVIWGLFAVYSVWEDKALLSAFGSLWLGMLQYAHHLQEFAISVCKEMRSESK